MNKVLLWLAVWLAGGALGVFFFGGLHWTIVKGLTSKQPAVWFFCSMLLRLFVTLAGFYFVAGVLWNRWLLCLLGFVMARVVIMRLTNHTGQRKNSISTEASDAH